MEKKKCCLVVMCGVPGSGKSWLSLNLLTWLIESEDYLPIVIKYDELMPPDMEQSLIDYQTEEKSLWKEYREDIVTCVGILIQNTVQTGHSSFNTLPNKVLLDKFTKMIIDQGILKGEPLTTEEKSHRSLENVTRDNKMKYTVIIIDDNMYYRSMRYDYYQLARTYALGFCEIYLDCSLETALERNSSRKGDYVDPEIIRNMVKKIQAPDKNNHTWENFSLVYSSLSPTSSRPGIIQLIETATSNPVDPVEDMAPEITAESQRICSTNMIHQADLIIRQLISERMIAAKGNSTNKQDLKHLSSRLADIKTRILGDLKEGKITLAVSEECIINSSKDKSSEFFQNISHYFDVMIS